MLLLEMLYPRAISPALSMAILGIQRDFESGANVPDWKIVGVALGLWISYQRTPVLLPEATECDATSDSWLPKLR